MTSFVINYPSILKNQRNHKNQSKSAVKNHLIKQGIPQTFQSAGFHYHLTSTLIISNNRQPTHNHDGDVSSDRLPKQHADVAARPSNLVYKHKYHRWEHILQIPIRGAGLGVQA